MHLLFSWSIASAQEAGSLQLCALDGDSLPISGVGLSIRRQTIQNGLVYEAITGKDGCTTLELPTGRWQVVAEHDAFTRISEDLAVQPGRRLQRVLRMHRPVIGCDYEAAWGAKATHGALLIERTPLEPGAAAAWSRGEAWLGLPTGVAIADATVAGPGERAPTVPWPAVGTVAVQRGGSARLAAPGGQIVTLGLAREPKADRDALLHLGGPLPHGAARMGPLSLEGTPTGGAAAATARVGETDDRLELLALGSTGEAADGLVLADGVLAPEARVRLRTTALARRWVQDGLGVDRLSLLAEGSWSQRAQLAAGARVERHAVMGGVPIGRIQLYADDELPVGRWLSLRAGLLAQHERRAEASRSQLAPRLQVALRSDHLRLELLGAVTGEPGVWMPDGVGVELPPTRTLRLELAHRLWQSGELWGGIRRIDVSSMGTLAEMDTLAGMDTGEIAAVGGLGWERGPLALDVDGAVCPAGRWSTATAAASWASSGALPRLGLVSVWRSGPGNAAPQGLDLALPFEEAAHLNAGARLGQPIPLRRQTLVLEGTLWMRAADSDPDDLQFSPVAALPTGELAARLEW